jgi:hypothetical protein
MGFVVEEGSHTPGLITLARLLDLYYLGAIISQQLGAIRTSDVVGKVQYLHVSQSLVCHFFPLSSYHYSGTFKFS